MALLVITINDPGLDTKHAEIAYARKAVEIALGELGRANGNATTGTILTGQGSGGTWSYTPSASKP